MAIEKLHIKFTNGEEWEIDTKPIAEARANFYANKCPTNESKSLVFKEEYEYTLNSREELVDWMHNCMEDEEIAKIGKQIQPPYKLSFKELLGEHILWIK